MKTAYFIAVHHKATQFQWLWRAIYSGMETYCIHVDAKSPQAFHTEIRKIVGDARNIHWLPSRSIAWAGWSMVVAELDAMRLMVAEGGDWQRWVNLSGQDYPVKPMEQIRDLLAASTSNHIRCCSFTEIAKGEPNDPHLKRRICLEYGGRIHHTPLRIPFPKKVNLEWKGSAWHMFTRSFCEWMVSSPLTRTVARTLRFTFCPDETFFQGLIMNGPFAETVDQDCGRFVLWPGPKTLTIEHFSEIRQSRSLFGRKFDHAVDDQILHELASVCCHNA